VKQQSRLNWRQFGSAARLTFLQSDFFSLTPRLQRLPFSLSIEQETVWDRQANSRIDDKVNRAVYHPAALLWQNT
jgi:hypothetical protein